MKSLLGHLVLPKEITPFEANYLKRMNRIGIIFFYLHLPIFTLIAWLNETGPATAAIWSAILLVGPTLAYLRFDNPRRISMTYGVTAMCFGALLVHIGQGPMQIEMHFYFFALIAALSLYGNPMVNVVAAVTVALHHALFWVYLPESVFNYDASVWVVAVHAAFVVVETPAACFISRSFFDNVIGLERIVRARTDALDAKNREMRLVLDNVRQGFVTLDRDRVLANERSAVVDRWFGDIPAGATLDAVLAPHDANAAMTLELGWDMVLDGFLPLEVALDALPSEVRVDERVLELAYRPIEGANGELRNLLVVITDVTEARQRARAEAEQREIVRVFERIVTDKLGFIEFFEEGNALVQRIADFDDAPDATALALLKRDLHTLKGNAGLFGINTLAERCHALENHIVEVGRAPGVAERRAIAERWERLRGAIKNLIGDDYHGTLEIDDADYDALLDAVLAGRTAGELETLVRGWRLEPMKRRLARIAEQARALAARLGKGELDITTNCNGLRLDPARWAHFWQAFVHVVRNAVDHGVEHPDERAEVGKPRAGRIEIHTAMADDAFVVHITDDGRGVDWDRISQKAAAMGLPADSEQALLDAMFTDGLTTRDAASMVSGRGVGMGAVVQACRDLGGSVDVRSEPGRGTTVSFRFPVDEMSEHARRFHDHWRPTLSGRHLRPRVAA